MYKKYPFSKILFLNIMYRTDIFFDAITQLRI